MKNAASSKSAGRHIPLSQWKKTLNAMADDIERWALEKNWSVFREPKVVEERGSRYEAPVVRIRSAHGEVWFDPVGSDIVGADGRIDFGHWPNADRFVLILRNGQWHAQTIDGKWIRRKWGPKLFHQLITTPRYPDL